VLASALGGSDPSNGGAQHELLRHGVDCRTDPSGPKDRVRADRLLRPRAELPRDRRRGGCPVFASCEFWAYLGAEYDYSPAAAERIVEVLEAVDRHLEEPELPIVF
jgi:hypothetical protein